jgi:hypothetical protein
MSAAKLRNISTRSYFDIIPHSTGPCVLHLLSTPYLHTDETVIMPAADFAAAQARLAARRRRIQDQNSARQRELDLARSTLNSRLPLPFRSFSDTTWSLWDSIKGREGTRPAFRVGQVDAELLDDELLELLKAQVGEGFKYFGV